MQYFSKDAFACLCCIDKLCLCFIFWFQMLYCKFTHIFVVQWVVKKKKKVQIKKKKRERGKQYKYTINIPSIEDRLVWDPWGQCLSHLFSKMHITVLARAGTNRDPLATPSICLQNLLLNAKKNS